MKLSNEMAYCLNRMRDGDKYWPERIGVSIATFRALERRGLVEQATGSNPLGRSFQITEAGKTVDTRLFT